jgi:hypothetical protein
LKSGADGTLLTGTVSTETAAVTVNADGDLVENANVLISSDGVFNPTGSPGFPLYDNDAVGADLADELTCYVKGNLTTTTEDAEVGDFFIECVIAGTHTEVMRFDASAGEWIFNYPITASGIDAGKPYANQGTGTLDLEGINSGNYYQTGVGVSLFQLPDDVVSATGVGKEFCFQARNITTAGELRVEPGDANDAFIQGATTYTVANYITNITAAALGDKICVKGRVAAANEFWIIWFSTGTWTQEGA